MNLIIKMAATMAALGLIGASIAAPQRKGGGGNHNRGGGQTRGGNSGGGVVHARRDVVRTPAAAPRQPQNNQPQNPPQQQRPNNRNNGPVRVQSPVQRNNGGTPRISVPNTPQRQFERKFTKTTQGRVYDNGLQLRKGIRPTANWEKPYFPHGYIHFPFYRPTYTKGQVFISPFGFFFGVCLPFIDPGHCHVYPPTFVFVDIPTYNGAVCQGYPDEQYDNWFDRQDLNDAEPGLVNAIDELSETFLNGDIDALASLISPNVSVAIYLRGKYRYSMDSADYVNLTRDALGSMHTTAFNLTRLYQRQDGVFSVSGTQEYTDQNGNARTVYVSYVLQDFSGQWTLTQAGSAPDRVQKW